MSVHQATLELDFAVPPQRLWDAITDHEGMSKWAGAPVRLISRGDADGVGALRRIKMGASSIDEEVIYTDAPRRLVYRIVRGLPVSFHRGEMLIEPTERGSKLTWKIMLASSVPGLARLSVRALGTALRPSLRTLRGLIGG